MKKVNRTDIELPLLALIREMGGEAKPADLYSTLADRVGVTEEDRNERIRPDSPHRTWDRLVRWVRQSLTETGLLEKSKRGIWILSEKGDALLKASTDAVVLVYEAVDKEGACCGIALWGDAAAVAAVLPEQFVSLMVTSPPYPLLTPKSYGNVAEREFVEWYLQYVKQYIRILKPTGSLILNLGPAYMKGQPVLSSYVQRLHLGLIDELGLHYAGHMYAHNQGKLPTTNWVTREKIRIKNVLEDVIWYSLNPNPYINKDELKEPYSESYLAVLNKGGYPKAKRPCGQELTHFKEDKGGKLIGNLLKANTVSRDPYFKFCREVGLQTHPARFSGMLVEKLIRLFSKPGDVTADLMGGSGMVMEKSLELNRKCVIGETSLNYILGSMGRRVFASGAFKTKINQELSAAVRQTVPELNIEGLGL